MVQRSRPVTSEYQVSFDKNKHKCSSKAYEQCLNYRAGRRILEHAHNADVFTWDYDDIESDGDNTDCGTSRRPASVPIHKLKHELFNKAYEKRTTKTEVAVNDAQVAVPVSSSILTNGHAAQEIIEKTSSLKLDIPSSDTERDTEKSNFGSSSTPSTEKDGKVKQKKIARKRPARRPQSSNPPFVLYGYNDAEAETGQKKTHNIRASAEIHPSALRASRRHRLEAERRRKLASDDNKKKRALYDDFMEKMKRETQAWGTEYKQHYAGYDANTYRRILSARFQPVRRPDLKGVYPSTM